MKALKPQQVDDCLFVDLSQSKSSRWGGDVTDEMREMQWVKPEWSRRYSSWNGPPKGA